MGSGLGSGSRVDGGADDDGGGGGDYMVVWQ